MRWLALAAFVVACSGPTATIPPHAIPSEADARAFVGRLAALARAGKLS
jgi:hypothetical protein